ncbi:hypothetical protein KY339_03255 [Candidatus Woesearchaeota archaeon]|nr:hypothetical protein [Candidatus Woesearchaeota archaeon]
MVKIIAHQSLTLTEHGKENPLGVKLIQHLDSRFSISPQGICSNAFYLEDMEKTYCDDFATRFMWYAGDARDRHRDQIMIPRDKEPLILLWGSGECHFVSQYISLKRQKYHKVVWDRHQDSNRLQAQYSMIGLVLPRAGCWLDSEARYNKNCESSTVLNREDMSCELQNQLIHGSVDLDVVSGFPARCDWQVDEKKQGKKTIYVDEKGITLDELTESLALVLGKNKPIRFDLGGLHLPVNGDKRRLPSSSNIADPLKSKEALDFAIACYERVLSIAYEHMG